MEYKGRFCTQLPFDCTGIDQLTLSYKTDIPVQFIYSSFKDGTLMERVAGLSSGSSIDLKGADNIYFCFYRLDNDIAHSVISDIQLEIGTKSTSYEPYGYKIPIVVSANNHESITVNIYLDKPLETGEILKFPENILVHADGTEENVILPEIPTFDGTTIITTDTELPPSNIEITYKARK